ncbi:MAG: hypothetical protein AB1421_07495 [Pseudomonadota bacterium]
MKTWLIPLPLLFAASLALAAEGVTEPIASPEAAAASEQAAPAQPVMKKHHKARRLPSGDLRHCLDLKDNKAIIACSEKRKKR